MLCDKNSVLVIIIVTSRVSWYQNDSFPFTTHKLWATTHLVHSIQGLAFQMLTTTEIRALQNVFTIEIMRFIVSPMLIRMHTYFEYVCVCIHRKNENSLCLFGFLAFTFQKCEWECNNLTKNYNKMKVSTALFAESCANIGLSRLTRINLGSK